MANLEQAFSRLVGKKRGSEKPYFNVVWFMQVFWYGCIQKQVHNSYLLLSFSLSHTAQSHSLYVYEDNLQLLRVYKAWW